MKLLILKSFPKSADCVIFEGEVSIVLLPGEAGEFEVLNFHKPIISRLKKGTLMVDNQKEFRILGGMAKFDQQKLVALVEQ